MLQILQFFIRNIVICILNTVIDIKKILNCFHFHFSEHELLMTTLMTFFMKMLVWTMWYVLWKFWNKQFLLRRLKQAHFVLGQTNFYLTMTDECKNNFLYFELISRPTVCLSIWNLICSNHPAFNKASRILSKKSKIQSWKAWNLFILKNVFFLTVKPLQKCLFKI